MCNCGGYAWPLNGRPEKQPHMAWCPQAKEYAEWYQALHGYEQDLDYTVKQPPPNEQWCVGCTPDNCPGGCLIMSEQTDRELIELAAKAAGIAGKWEQG